MQHRTARPAMSAAAPNPSAARPLAASARRGLATAGALALAALLVACGGDADPEAGPDAGSDAGSRAGADGGEDPGAAAGASEGGSTGASGAAAPDDAVDPVAGDTPAFGCPEGWTELDEPTKPMRIREYEKRGDAGRLELVVYEFQNAVGGLDMNLARWAQPREVATLTDDELGEIEVGEFVVTTLFLEVEEEADAGAGDIAHGTVGAGKFFAYIERPGASRVWTAKASGPAGAMRAERAALEAFVQDL